MFMFIELPVTKSRVQISDSKVMQVCIVSASLEVRRESPQYESNNEAFPLKQLTT